MVTPPPSGFENAPRTLDDVVGSLNEAHALAVAGDIAGAQHRMQQIKLWLLARADEAPLSGDFEAAQRLWVDTLSDLIALLEERGAYLEALAYARDLAQQNPMHQTDVRRLARMYVLTGSRAPYLTTLQNRIRAAERGNGSLVLIRGVAGIGKSALAQASAAWARRQGAITVTGRCYERGVALPLTPWQEALQLLGEAVGADHGHLPAPFGNQPPADSADSLLERIGMHLYDLAAENVVVLLLEDLHWADQETLNLLEYVTRRIERVPLLIIGTYRSDEVADDHPLYPLLPTLQRDRPTDMVRLTAFTKDDTSRFIESHLGRCRSDLVNYLHERAEGHPLFLVELLDGLIEQGLLHQAADGRWMPPDRSAPIPTLLRQVILQRVARLGQPCEILLDIAAVMGEVWRLSVVESILDWAEDQLLGEMDKILAAQLIEAIDTRGERYRFSHGLIREALYERQLPRRRRHLHAQIADLLEAESRTQMGSGLPTTENIVGALANHYFQAERWVEAFHYNREAGFEAHRLNAVHSVVRYYRQALLAEQQCGDELAPNLLLNLLEQLGDAHVLLSQKDEALEIFERMLDAASDTEDKTRVAQALFHLAEAQERTYDHDQSEKTLQAALELVTDVDAPHLMMRYHFAIGHHHLVTGGLERTRYHLSEMERYAQIDDDKRSLANAKRYQAYVAIFQGEYRWAADLAQQVKTHALATSNAPLLTVANWLHGFALTELGDYEQSREILLDGLAQRETIGDQQFYVARIRNSLGYLHRELGDLEAAKRWNRESLELNPQDAAHRAVECACYSLLDLASNCLDAGQLEASAAYLRDFGAASDQNRYVRYRSLNRAKLLAAELALAQGAYEEALVHASQAIEMAERETMRKNMAKGLLNQGCALLGMGQLEEAADCLKQSVELADQIEHAALRWQTRLRLADVYAQSEIRHLGLYQEALALVEQIAQNLHDPHLRNSFLSKPLVVELMEKAQSDAPKDGALPPATDLRPAGLSKREVEVLQLVANGLTDRQISEQLHISVRTVNTHVANILNKTNCHNRAAASAFAAQNGLMDAAS